MVATTCSAREELQICCVQQMALVHHSHLSQSSITECRPNPPTFLQATLQAFGAHLYGPICQPAAIPALFRLYRKRGQSATLNISITHFPVPGNKAAAGSDFVTTPCYTPAGFGCQCSPSIVLYAHLDIALHRPAKTRCRASHCGPSSPCSSMEHGV
jgi:hypothetical protein